MPVVGATAIVPGVVGLPRARSYGAPVDDAVIGIILGAAALATPVAGIWIFRHVIGRAMHDATAESR